MIREHFHHARSAIVIMYCNALMRLMDRCKYDWQLRAVVWLAEHTTPKDF